MLFLYSLIINKTTKNSFFLKNISMFCKTKNLNRRIKYFNNIKFEKYFQKKENNLFFFENIFIDKSKEFIKEGTEDHHQNLLHYLDLKLLFEKKVKCMTKWRKTSCNGKKRFKKC
jgi:hypothetical protein